MTKRQVTISDSGLRGLTGQVRDLCIKNIKFSKDGNLIIQLEDDIEIEISKENEWNISMNC